MNLPVVFEKGQEGRNRGLTTGIPELNRSINGVQRKHIYAIAAAPKVGKTTLADACFVLAPWEQMIKEGKTDKIKWTYFSYEIDRISKEFKYASYYFFLDHNISQFIWKEKVYEMSAEYLMGMMTDDEDQPIVVSQEHKDILIRIYNQRIIPLFGEYDTAGQKIHKGKIDFITEKENPTGIRNYIMNVAKQNGRLITEPYTTEDDKGRPVTRHRIVGYEANDPEEYWIILTDHMRKPRIEQGFTLKQNVDKLSEYHVELRDLIGCTFVDIVHTNRNLASVERMKHAGEFIYPTGDDLKDTGNLSEDANVVLTMFNPSDDKYNLTKHFGVEVDKHPKYRSIHVVEARNAPVCPAHIQVNMFGGINYFGPLTNS